MSDPVLAIVLIVSFTAAVALARWFKTLDPDIVPAARTPVIAGVIAGLLIRFISPSSIVLHVVTVGVVMTIAGLYVRLTGEESEATDGMLLGALSGAAAAVPLVVSGERELRAFSECTLAGAVAGFGITFALFHVANKVRQLVFDVVTAAAAVGAAYVPDVLVRFGIPESQVAIGTAALIPLIVIATVFRQWPDIRAELRHEASLGFIDDRDVRPTAHPLLRLARAGWTDRHAHREFVRIANRIALRKRQQRSRPEDTARIYQLEIIKLRMHLQEMTRIDRLAAARRRASASPSGEVRSDTIAHD